MDAALSVPMTATPTFDEDARLLRAFAERGDREAFAELLRRHLDACWRLALRLSGNAADAEDVLQEATLIAMRQARRWRGGSVRAWLLGIVANAQRDLARATRRRERRERSSSPPQPEPACDDELREAAVAALAELPDAYRAPVCLRYLEGLDFPAIAAALRLRERTARTRVSRGLERLRELLAPQRAGIGAEGVAALIVSMPTPPAPATVSAAVMKTAASAPLAAATATPAVIASVLVTALAAAGAVGFHGWHRSVGTPAPLIVPGDPVDARSGLERVLDLRLDIAFYHQAKPLPLIESHLPPGTVFAYAWPFAPSQLPWTGASVAGKGLRLRDVLDRICGQLGLAWEVDDGYVLFFRPMQAEDREADLAILERTSASEAGVIARREAAERLAWSRDKQALREALFAALSEADDRMAHAAAQGLLNGHGTPWPTRRRGTLLHAFIDDQELKTEIGRHLARDGAGSSPALLYLGGVLRVPEAAPALRAAAALAFAPAVTDASARGNETKVAIAVACGELGPAWPDGRPAPLDLLAGELVSNREPFVRLACAHGLVRCGDARAIGAVTELWKQHGWSVSQADLLAQATVEAYDACGDHGSLVPMLAAVVGGTEATLAGPAADALGRIRDPAAIAPLVALMRRTDAYADCVLSALASMRLPGEIAAVRAAGENAPAEVVEQMAGLRVWLGDAAAIPILDDLARRDQERVGVEFDYLDAPDLPEADAAACRLAAAIGPSSYATLAMHQSPAVIAFFAGVLADAAASAERKRPAVEALRQIDDPAALDAAAAADDGGFNPKCPGWIDALAAMDRNQPLPRAADYPGMPTRAEAAQRIERAFTLSDRLRGGAIQAAAVMLENDPSLPREGFLARLRASLAEDPEARSIVVWWLSQLCHPDDAAARDAIVAAIAHDGDYRVRTAARQALTALGQRLEALYELDLLRLGHIPPDEQARTEMEAAIKASKEDEFDRPKASSPGPDAAPRRKGDF